MQQRSKQKRELVNVSGNSFFISDRNNEISAIGLYIIPDTNKFVLFDTGLSTAVAKEVMAAIKFYNSELELFAIVNTHHHVDHIGGNRYFQNANSDLRIYATDKEKPFIEWPKLEIACFSCGAEPVSKLHSRHLEAESSTVTDIIDGSKDSEINILGAKFQIIILPGHTFGHIGIITPDKVFYTGDAILGKNSLNKHFIPLNINIKEALFSFKRILELPINHTVIYHGGLLDSSLSLPDLVQLHINKIENLINLIKELLANNQICLEDLTQKVTEGHVPEDKDRAVVFITLARATTQAFLSYLEQLGEIQPSVKNGKMIFELLSQPQNQINNKF